MKYLEFRKMRRSDKELPENEAREMLKKGSFGVLSTADINGMPYGVPINYVYEDGRIFIHCASSGHKLDNISQNSHVSFCVVEYAKVIPERFSTNFRSAIALGKASVVDNVEEKIEALKKLVSKYSSDYIQEGITEINNSLEATSIIRIDVLHLTGKFANG
ncbi:pyridoxamine 5'-phosphate oxidase family protein [Mesotoga prima]|uniref:pyridoxamine 5'-phosphate oxidase family protein n=1 Tax=Mesotoga prima TaxID=1184387 RepID=UPI002C2A39C9|nr:pyridoxamine 5'-phosphate oxidase family protein [Mesotoga prima]HNQ71476.1 pyridoxamine 5'-phosphate oxidase family protein [Mesotoga prima]